MCEHEQTLPVRGREVSCTGLTCHYLVRLIHTDLHGLHPTSPRDHLLTLSEGIRRVSVGLHPN